MTAQKVMQSYSFEDELGTRASLALYSTQDDGDLISDADANWTAMGGLLNAVSASTIKGGATTIVHGAVAKGGGEAVAGGRVEQNALLNYLVTSSLRHHGVAIPAIGDAFITGGRVPNSGAVATLTAALTGALANGTGAWSSSDWLALGALADISLAFRKHRRQLSRESLEAF